MSMFNFKEAQREKVKLRIALTGAAGSGKTLSSLYLAYGIAGDWKKVVVIDSEQGRALYYANRSDLGTGTFLHCNLEPPYSADRYCEAMKEAAEIAGSDGVVVIDSITQAWSGDGGVLSQKEIIAQQRGKTDFSAWADAGKIQNRLVDTMMSLDTNIIVTIRSKTAYTQETDPETGKTRVRKLGLEPEQRSNFEYEMAIVFLCDKDTHNCEILKDNCTLEAEGFYGRITPEVGKRLREWASEGKEPEIHKCECCGNKITPYRFEDGTVMGVQEIVSRSLESFGKELCMNCCIEISQQEENNEEETVEEE